MSNNKNECSPPVDGMLWYPYAARSVWSILKGTMNVTRCRVNELEKCGSVTITFTNMRRVCVLSDKFEECNGFTKELGARRKWLSLELGRKQYTRKNRQYRVFLRWVFYDFMHLKWSMLWCVICFHFIEIFCNWKITGSNLWQNHKTQL